MIYKRIRVVYGVVVTNKLSILPENCGDFTFLLSLYRTTREWELNLLDWTDEQKDHFVLSQFNAQRLHYRKYYPDASFDLVLYKGEKIGRFYIEEWPSQFRIIDITLYPQFCGQSIGSLLIKKLMQQAVETGKNISIHVERNNPALRLYERLNFKKIDELNIYNLMEWRPPKGL